MYIDAGPDVLFGDIFEAQYLFDVHLQGDATRLARGAFPRRAPLTGTFFAEPQENLALNTDVVVAHGRSGQEKEGREHKGTYDRPGQALLVSDDCHIPTAYGDRPDRSGARGRLMFAPIVPVDEDELRAVAEGSSYSRFALPAAGRISQPSVAELKRVFQVNARAVDPEDRIGALDDDSRQQLEKRWAAFACRRGPLVSNENASKLARLMAGSAEPSEPQVTAVTTLWQTLDLGWDIEGRIMRRASDALEQEHPARPVVEEVVDGLRGLVELAGLAADRLEGVKPD